MKQLAYLGLLTIFILGVSLVFSVVGCDGKVARSLAPEDTREVDTVYIHTYVYIKPENCTDTCTVDTVWADRQCEDTHGHNNHHWRGRGFGHCNHKDTL